MLVVSLSRTIFGLYIYIEWLRKAFCSLELRVQFCLLVCCTYPSLLTVNKEKNRTDQRASLRVDMRETQHYQYVCKESMANLMEETSRLEAA